MKTVTISKAIFLGVICLTFEVTQMVIRLNKQIEIKSEIHYYSGLYRTIFAGNSIPMYSEDSDDGVTETRVNTIFAIRMKTFQ